MAKSRAKKRREHHLRNTRRDVTQSRGHHPDFSTFERKTKSRLDMVIKEQTKHKKRSLFEREVPLNSDRFFHSL
ncbi:hypothetical protein [Rossellomorea aquimaris]|uniref:hypothetical protein n=1 Tax=Rossellomorea aquimaris TaxID=189382 RepID=UPI0007D06D00|nr:hypothetical protein [Rossellomorea aquimaris]